MKKKLSSLKKHACFFSKPLCKDKRYGRDIHTPFDLTLNNPVELDFDFGRGLNYYTGAIIEVKAREHAYGIL
jgi:histidyl-tRNA synthetase